MLRGGAREGLALALLLAPVAAPAHAAPTPPSLRTPERLTAGPSDQLLGTLSSTGTLYYVDDAGTSTEVATLDAGSGAAGPLFDDAADATWPRPSPDGTRVLYLSRQTNAAGQLCVRALPLPSKAGARGGEPVGERRCLTDEKGAALQALWWPDGQSIAVLVRASLDDDLRIERYAPDGGGRRTLLTRNLASPTISPDGRWLAYVPIARGSTEVGPSFAARAGRAIELQRLGSDGTATGAPTSVSFALPGASGLPAFSSDGKWLYLTHYLDDTNLDGVVDGNDHGVLLRAPFDAARGALDVARVEQLTSGEWDCRYPSPARERLIATCSFGQKDDRSLHVYALPLEGVVPSTWSAARLDEEIAAARSSWDRLLLVARKLAIESPAARPRDLLLALRLHLSVGALQSADDDAARLGALGSPLGPALVELVAFRRAERALDRGELDEPFVTDARARLERLAAVTSPPSARALALLVRSEILDTIGDEAGEREALLAVAPATVDEPFVLRLVAERSVASYRLVRAADDRAPLLATLRALSDHDHLDERARLEMADVYVRELLRGRPLVEHARLLDGVHAERGSTLELRVALESALVGLAPSTQEPVRARVLELYRKNRELDRRRQIVAVTVDRAAPLDGDFLVYEFADTWVSYVDRGTAERPRAEALYRRVVLERAYSELARGVLGDARGHFFGVTLQTDSLEAYAGFLELRAREGKDGMAELRSRLKKGDPVLGFAEAYLVARSLDLEKAPLPATLARIDQALAALRSSSLTLGQRAELQLLWTYLAHRRWRLRHERLDALAATTHALLALDLARAHPRLRASILEELAFVEADVGNHALALGHIVEREALPFADAATELALRLWKARALLHTDRDTEAAAEAERALALVEGTPALARYRPLALDRAALAHLSAHEADPARERYTQLLALVDAKDTRALLALHLGRAGASVSDGQGGLALPDLAAAAPLVEALLEPRRTTSAMLLHGLDAAAREQAGDLAGATRALERRRALYEARRAAPHPLDDDTHELAIIEGALGRLAYRSKDAAAARVHVERALAHADAWGKAVATPVDDTLLALVAALAEVRLYGKVARASFVEDPGQRIARTLALLGARHNPTWEPARRRLVAYSALLALQPSE